MTRDEILADYQAGNMTYGEAFTRLAFAEVRDPRQALEQARLAGPEDVAGWLPGSPGWSKPMLARWRDQQVDAVAHLLDDVALGYVLGLGRGAQASLCRPFEAAVDVSDATWLLAGAGLVELHRTGAVLHDYWVLTDAGRARRAAAEPGAVVAGGAA